MLVHICCSVDSHFFLQKLSDKYPEKNLTGYFYDPNIHPYSEYKLRLMDVKRSCQKLGIKLLEGEYDYEGWIEAVRGLEDEPEKGKRCTVCFDNRLAKTAEKALEIGENEITTTLLTSPKKSIEQLINNSQEVEKKFGVKVLTPDFRKNGGTSEQFMLAKKDMLYHQNYCGCIFALEVQRENQERLKDELMSPITKQILPSSIEDRIELYENVNLCEQNNQKFKLRREKFLNYRLLRAYVREQKKDVIPSYFIFYSKFSREFTKGKIESIEDDIGYFNREDVIFISIKKLNILLNKSYKSIKDLMDNPLIFEDEIKIRNSLANSILPTLNPIIVIDELSEKKYEIYLKSEIYMDIRENLVKI
ncbi:MAG: epoxyqueuosine reductase QueH [Sulfurospirillaceae bacterium]|nr:epoxyqueuosine reductase QueH [Sulfurospirillaceae bacterium]